MEDLLGMALLALLACTAVCLVGAWAHAGLILLELRRLRQADPSAQAGSRIARYSRRAWAFVGAFGVSLAGLVAIVAFAPT